jgi:hypothetical protein
VLYREAASAWEYLGGTYDEESKTIKTVTDSLGRFGVFAVSPTSTKDVEALLTLTLTPRAFSPAGGTLRGELSVGFTLAEPGPATIKIYNVAGRLVRVLTENQTMVSGANVVTWTGRDYDERIVPSGLYVVTVEAGGRIAKSTVAVVNQ